MKKSVLAKGLSQRRGRVVDGHANVFTDDQGRAVCGMIVRCPHPRCRHGALYEVALSGLGIIFCKGCKKRIGVVVHWATDSTEVGAVAQ